MKVLLPYLDNPSEKVLSESCQVKKQHETMKLLNEEIRMLQQNNSRS